MIHKTTLKNCILLIVTILLLGCGKNDNDTLTVGNVDNSEKIITSVKQLEGKKVAAITGTIFDSMTNDFVDNVNYLFFDDNSSMTQALLDGKIDAVLFDEPIARLYEKKHSNELYLASIFLEDQYSFVLEKNSPLTPKIDKIINDLDKSGQLAVIKNKWISADPTKADLDVLIYKKDYTGKNGTLRLGADLTQEPMAYLGSKHTAIGIEIEVANRIAYELDMKLEIISMKFSALIASVASGKVDMAVGSISKTQERQKLVDMTYPYYIGGVSILAKYPQNYKKNLSTGEQEAILSKTGRAGVMAGSYGELFVDLDLKNKNIYSYDSFSDGIPALKAKKIDYIIGSYTSLIIFERANKDLIVLPTPLTEDGNAIAFKKGSSKLRENVDEVIDKFKKDGTLADLERRWIKNFDYNMPKIEVDSSLPILKVGVSANREPVCFFQDIDIVGFDSELIERIAKELNMRVQYYDMKFSSLIPALLSNKVDLIISNITKTQERAKIVDFTQVYFNNPQSLIVHKDTYNKIFDKSDSFEEKELDILTSLKRSFYGTFIQENRYKLILNGLWVTISISLATAVLGLFLGLVVCSMRCSKKIFINIPAKIYIRAMQGTPMVVLLMILYYIVFASCNINAILVAIVGFSMNFAAYAAEIMRTGFESIDKGQTEAASSMGYSKFQVFKNIIFPQAARHSIPVLQGEFISTVKMTSVVGYIAIQDLTRVSDIIRGRTYEAFFPLISTAIIYFILAYTFTLVLRYVEIKIDPKSRKRTIGKVVL